MKKNQQAEDLVSRLRSEGENALRKHTSLGMWGLCAEAADRIEELEAALRVLTDACVYEFGTPDDSDPDDSSVFANLPSGCGITFGMLRGARAALVGKS